MQYLYIDNRDGFGPRDFTTFLLDSNQFFSHTKNEPQLFDFTIVDTGENYTHYADVVRSTGLMGYWRFGELAGTNAADSSGRGNTGTYTGGVTLNQTSNLADGNPSATFDGTGYVAVNYADLRQAGAFTAVAWVKPTTLAGSDRTIIRCGIGATDMLFWMALDSSGKLQSGHYNGSSFELPTTPNAVALLNRWTFVAVSRESDGKTYKFYVNGELISTSVTTGTPVAASTQVGRIGMGNAVAQFIGGLDEVALYNRALTAAELAAQYAARTDTGRPDNEFVVPTHGAYVRFIDENWDNRFPGGENGVLFTGYVTEDPDPVFLGVGAGGNRKWSYRIYCTSDEFLANSKRLPAKTYVNKTRGYILKDLLTELFADSSPFPFDTSGVADGGTERLFQVDTNQKWSELVSAFANADGFTYYILDGYLFYGPEAAVTTYNDPFYKLTLDEYDPRFAADRLNIKRVARDIVNDVTVLGLEEPADVVREHFVSDGYQGFHNLAFDPYGVIESTLVTDDFTSDIDTSIWEEKDTITNYIQFFDGALNIIGGPGTPATASTARTVYLLARRPIEMSGVIEFRDGEIYFPPSPTGTGIIGGLYTDTTLSQNALWSGWYLDCANGVFQPLGAGGTNVGTAYAFLATRHYVLRRTIQVDRPVGNAQYYNQTSTGTSYGYDSVLQPNVHITFTIDEINNDDPAAVITRSTVVANYTVTSSNPPDYLLYAAAAPNNCHYVTNYLSVIKPQQAVLLVEGQPTKLGSFLDGGRALLQSENGQGRLAWYATPTGSGNVSYPNTILGDGPEGYWRLGENATTTYQDASGHAHGATSVNVTQGAAGAINSETDFSTQFNGTTSYIQGVAFAASTAGVGAIEGWFRTSATTGVRTIYSNRNSSGVGEFYAIYGGQFNWGSDYGGGSNHLSTRTNLNDGRWHHFVVSFSSGGGSNNSKLYLDGILDKVVTMPRLPPNQVWFFGRDTYVDNTSPGDGYFSGYLDEMAIYKDVALSDEQVAKHFAAGMTSLGQVVTIPPAGSVIRIYYYRKQTARARLRSTESIATEQERYRDNGVRQRVIRADEISPSPRTSEECLALAQAYTNDAIRVRYEGSYSFETVAGTTTELAFWPRPGDLVECSLDLPTGDIVAEPLSVQTVKGTFLGKNAYRIDLEFGPVNRWDIVIRNMILQRKSSFDDPVIQTADADTLEAINTAYPYPADLLDCVVSGITTTQVGINLASAGIPSDVVNYEIRTDDTGWGNTNAGSGYVARFRAASHVIDRTQRDQVYYIRPYNAAGLYSKRSTIVRVVFPMGNNNVMSGVTGDISGSRIRVTAPIPRDPDYAGVTVRLGDASAASASSPVVYKGNGDQHVTLGSGVEVILTVGKITVDIPNPSGFSSVYVWVNTYNLASQEGTAQTVQITNVADGTWGVPTFSASYFTANPGSWTVSSGNVNDFSYTRNQKTMTVSVDVASTTIAGSPTELRVTLPNALSAARTTSVTCALTDNGTRVIGVMSIVTGSTFIKIKRLDNAAFTNAGGAAVQGQITFAV